MKIENTKISDCRVRLVISADAEETRSDYEQVVGQYRKNARIPGFRPGKAPVEVIKKFYGQQLDGDIKERLTERLCAEAAKQEKIETVARVSIDNVVFTPDTGISFEVEFDVKPQFKLPKYQKIPVKFNEIKVDEAEIEKRIAELRQQVSPRKDTEEPVTNGDMVQISFEAKSGRKMLIDVAPDADRLAKAEGFWTFVDEGQKYIPGLSEALVGKKKEEEFAFETKFPKDYQLESLRGVKAKYAGKIMAVRRAELVSDDELAKAYGQESLEKFRENLRKYSEDEAQRAEDKRVNDEISEYLIKKTSFEVPETLVLAYEDGKLEELIRGLGKSRQEAEEYAREHAEELKKQAHEAAEGKARLNYVLEAIAAEQKITVSDEDLKKEVESAAEYFKMRGDKSMTAEKLMYSLYTSGRIVLVKMDLLASKVIKWLAEDLKANAAK